MAGACGGGSGGGDGEQAAGSTTTTAAPVASTGTTAPVADPFRVEHIELPPATVDAIVAAGVPSGPPDDASRL